MAVYLCFGRSNSYFGLQEHVKAFQTGTSDETEVVPAAESCFEWEAEHPVLVIEQEARWNSLP